MRNFRRWNSHGAPLAFSDLSSRRASAEEIGDALTKAKTAEEAVQAINDLTGDNYKLDNQDETQIRLMATDPWGNVHYISMERDTLDPSTYVELKQILTKAGVTKDIEKVINEISTLFL